MSFGRPSYPQPTLRSPHCIQIALFPGALKRLPWRMWSRCRHPSGRSRDRWPWRLPCPGGQTLRGEASVGRPAGSRRTRGYNSWGWNVPGLYILSRHGRHGLSKLLLSSLLNGHFIEKPWTLRHPQQSRSLDFPKFPGPGESSAWQQWPCTSGGFGGFGPGPVPKLRLRHALHGKRSFTSRLGCETSAGNTLCHGTKVESQQPNLEFSHLRHLQS